MTDDLPGHLQAGEAASLAGLNIGRPLEPQVRRRIRDALSASPDGIQADDARRLWRRLRGLLVFEGGLTTCDVAAAELACWAMCLPRDAERPDGAGGDLCRLRERLMRAGEMLVEALPDAPDHLVDRTTDLLRDAARRPAAGVAARFLADLLQLDDFGVAGVLRRARRGATPDALLRRWRLRDAWGYWDARLGADFASDVIRATARRRLESARRFYRDLAAELDDTAAGS